MRFELSESELVVRHDDGTVVWRGRPMDAPVQAISPLESGEAAIVLLDYTARPGPFPNLIRIGSRGQVEWVAPLPQTASADAFVAMGWHEGELTAHTWSGYRTRIDVETGAITDQRFAK